MLIVELLDETEARFNPETAERLAAGDGWTLYRSKTGRLVVVETSGGSSTAYEIPGDELMDWAEGARWISSEMQEIVAASKAHLPEI